ncbi:MAG TPA: hypothetical protein PLZ93_02255 [Nocardioides sp.]|uniref:hypothetical protein n=1 Tax=uncultured Nocardioides sp. TaxID=198441 RepID=UPI000EEBBD45|nr:hypothetical protein [uncultured Nocardioides sp.]HCB06280.1 hypothetical protein [Nocardioides sp.]HRD61332.1 hypothetical protein [Nocardioides sp.]HRI94418.1 hypothetical protein [Nocardioides sp.]HRK44342.1 hypothetical protein [Nocardioides sp.]
MSAADTRRRWAREQIAKAGPVAIYGSPEWADLSEREKWVSALRFAEAKAQEFEEQMAALRAQHLFAARQAKQAADAEYVARRDNHRREYERRSYRPHPANRRGAA